MYRIRLAIVAFLLATIGLQAQEGFYYQAVIKNTDGSPLKETPVKIRIRIIEGTTTLQYEEEKEVTTSREGFVSFIIGEGATTDFTSINWQGELYLQDEIDTGAGYGAPTRMPLLKTPRSYISDRALSVLDNSITSASILDGTISNDDLSAAASISFSKLSISASDIEGLGFLQSDENFTSALKTKLDGIEAGAQVTDATSVEAAGALMDSEVTNLADLKAFDPADYATAAQGALADSAQQILTEGAFVDGDKTKLDGIEAGAQVTDATSVEAAGALMDSEVTNLADLKAFDPADYATAAQGALADSAQQILTEGVFLDGDKTKLDGIEAGAQVTDATSVEAAGALMDSEVTNLADLKAFDPADYATAAQGALADSAQQILTEGAFVDGDKTKLDGIEAGANAYSLPTATSDILGGVKVGAGIIITDGVIAIGQAVGTSDDVSFNSVTAAIAGNVTGDILAADGTSILDNGTDGTDATFTGNVTGTVSSLANQDSDALTEGSTNLYFTDARAQGAITAGTGVSITSGQIAIGQAIGTSDDVSFNSVTAAIAGNVTGDILAADGTSILDNGTDGTDATFTGNVTGTVSSLANQDSDALTEGSTNLYFTDARAQGAITAGTGVSITSGQIAIGQAIGTSDDVSFNSVTAAIAGNVTGDILAADGTSILDNGTDGTDATFTGNSATATTLSSTLPINLGGTGSTSAPMIGVITAADEVAARTQLDILSDTFTWVLSDNTSQSKTVTVSGLTSTSIVTVTPNSNINPQTFYVEPNNGSFTIYSSGNLANGTTFSYIAIIK